MKAWIARDDDLVYENSLYLYFNKKPKKCEVAWIADDVYVELDSKLFPKVKWKDKEPTEVELTITIKQQTK